MKKTHSYFAPLSVNDLNLYRTTIPFARRGSRLERVARLVPFRRQERSMRVVRAREISFPGTIRS